MSHSYFLDEKNTEIFILRFLFFRGKNQRGKPSEGYNGANEADTRPPEAADTAFRNDTSSSRKVVDLNEPEGVVTSLQDRAKWPELNAAKKVRIF